MKTKGSKRGGFFKVLVAERLFKHLPFVYLLSALALLYIANTHYAERMLRKREKLKDEVQESRWKYMSAKSQLMNETTQSNVEKRLERSGLSAESGMPKNVD